MNRWEVSPDGETAVGTPVPVIGDGDMFAVVSPIWSDVDGLRVSIDWSRTIVGDFKATEDMSVVQAIALANTLRTVTAIDPPR